MRYSPESYFPVSAPGRRFRCQCLVDRLGRLYLLGRRRLAGGTQRGCHTNCLFILLILLSFLSFTPEEYVSCYIGTITNPKEPATYRPAYKPRQKKSTSSALPRGQLLPVVECRSQQRVVLLPVLDKVNLPISNYFIYIFTEATMLNLVLKGAKTPAMELRRHRELSECEFDMRASLKPSGNRVALR